MHTLEGLPILKHAEALQSSGKEKNAWAVLQEFFDFFGKDSAEEHLWYMLAMVLQSDNEEIVPRHRSNMIFFYEYSIAFYKAARFLYAQQKKKQGKKRNNSSS